MADDKPETSAPEAAEHPALDTDPRARASEDSNRIDLNDPTRTGAEIAAGHLAAQAKSKS